MVIRQWPCRNPSLREIDREGSLIDLKRAGQVCSSIFSTCLDNLRFKEYLLRVEERLEPMYEARRYHNPETIREKDPDRRYGWPSLSSLSKISKLLGSDMLHIPSSPDILLFEPHASKPRTSKTR